MAVGAVTEERCECCDLLVASCGKRRPGVVIDPYDGVLIASFIVAKYDGSRCQLIDEHRITAGTTIGMAVHEDGSRVGWVCAECVERVTGLR